MLLKPKPEVRADRPARRRSDFAMFLLIFFSISACQTTYDRGLSAANNIVAETGMGTIDHDTRPSDALPVSAAFVESEFAKKVRSAVLSFPSLAGQQAQLQTTVAQMDALVGSLRPQFSSGFTAGQSLLGDGDGATANFRVTARQLVFDGAATQNRIAQSRIDQLRLSFELDGLLSNLSQQMALAWLDLWQQNELKLLAEEDVRAHQEFVEQTRSRVAGGVVAQSDLLSASSRLADANVRMAQAQSAVGQARASFLALIGPVPSSVGVPPLPPRLTEASLRQRISTSSQIAVLKLDLSRAVSQRDVVVSRRYPAVFLELNGTQGDILGDDSDSDVSVGFSVDHTFSSGGQQSAREREAEGEIEAAERVVDEAARQLKQALEISIANRQAIAIEVEAAGEAIHFNQSNLEAIREQFGIGRRGIVDILDAQRDLSLALSREVAVRARQIEIELQILTLTGDLAQAFGIHYDPHSAVLNGQALTASAPVSEGR